MKRVRRDKLEIWRDFLFVVDYEGEVIPTKIMRLANIQYTTFKEMLTTMERRGFIEKADTDRLRSKVYSLTAKGKAFLKIIEEVYRVLESEPDVMPPIWMAHKIYELKEQPIEKPVFDNA